VSVCLSVCGSVFHTIGISKTDAARTTELDVEMFYYESSKPTNFGFKRSKVKVTKHKNTAGVGQDAFVSAGFFSLFDAVSRMSCSLEGDILQH